MGLNGPQRATCVMSAPGGEGRFACCRGWGARLAPRSALQAVPRAAALWRSLLPVRVQCASSAPQSPPSPAAPVPFCGGVIVSQPVVRGCRHGGLRLKDFMPARRRLAAAARAAQKAARHSFPPRKPPQPAPVRVVMQRQTPVRQWCRRAPFRRLRTLCRPHPQTRAVAPPCRRRRSTAAPSRVAGNGLSGKRNDRFVAVVIW
nr:Uncharacterised protein [Escherichia coli]